MASQVSHIIYAQNYLEKISVNGINNPDEFVLGCVFPDIRRIDESIKRKDTHLRFDPIDLDFSGLSDFEAGWKFHLYCDMRREEILNNYGFYKLPNTADFSNLPAKTLEDELIYDACQNWEKWVVYFNNAPAVETGIGVARETFALWYAIVAKYLERKPYNRSISIFFSKQGSLVRKSGDIIKTMEKLRKDKKAAEILRKVKEEIV